MKVKKYIFKTSESCMNSCDCTCTLYNNLLIFGEVESLTPPLHKDCHCYLIPENTLIFSLIQLRKAWLDLLKAFGVEWLVRKLDRGLRKLRLYEKEE